MPGNLERFLRRRISEDEERTALENLRAPVRTSDQRAFGPCPHGAASWIDCEGCTTAADRDDG